jgi:lipoate-protein ligase A
LCQRNASQEWLYGRDLPLNFSCSDRFSWGELVLDLEIERGRINKVQVYTDSMDWQLAAILEQTLTNIEFSIQQLSQALTTTELKPDIRQDIINLLTKQEI